ncbi:MAG: BRO family protein [Anaerococcus sp.]|nr:BRO family protein [Anaerococcus sp.]
MNDLKIFKKSKIWGLRTVVDENIEHWFVASDICKAIEIKDTIDALKRLYEDEKSRL